MKDFVISFSKSGKCQQRCFSNFDSGLEYIKRYIGKLYSFSFQLEYTNHYSFYFLTTPYPNSRIFVNFSIPLEVDLNEIFLKLLSSAEQVSRTLSD